MSNKPKILFYDMETSPLLAYIWSTGEQYVGHGQLHKDRNMWDIICITYCYNDGKPAKHLDFDYDKQDSTEMIRTFDKLIDEADIVIGKNNKRFDDKMLNSIRMFKGLPCNAGWGNRTADLERLMRKYFRLPSQSLDYISHKLGQGGKIKMQMSDWIDIIEKNENGRKAFNKMIKYGKKDIVDTRAIWNYCEDHFEPIYHMGMAINPDSGEPMCPYCGSEDLRHKGYRYNKSGTVKRVLCNDCGKESSGKGTNAKKF